MTGLHRDLGIRAALMALVYVLFALQLPNFRTVAGIAALLDGAVLTGVIAIGVGLTIIAGEMDLSVGSMAALSGVVAVKAIGLGLLPAVLATVAFAGVLGALQGWAITLLDIDSLIFTVGTLIGLRGVTLLVSGEQTALVPIDLLSETDAVGGRFGVVSPLSATLMLVAILAGVFTTRTIWGREIFAIGSGRAEARAAGVSTQRPVILCFTFSAALAGLAGALLCLRSGSAAPLGFDAVLLDSITTCLIGGVALKGGRGGILGILIGLFTLRFLVSGIASLGAPFWAQSLATGALLILVIVVEAASRGLERRRRFTGAASAPAAG